MADEDDAPQTAAVEVTVLGVEHVRKTGSLLALVTFKVSIGGVELVVQGAQVRKAPLGQIELRAPEFRSGTGQWLPSVLLADEIMLQVLSELGTEWPPADASRLPTMTTAPPELTFSFAPRVVSR